MLKKIKQWFWARKFFFLFVLFFFLTIHYGAGYYSQKKATATYKAKWEAVSALFKPTATACPAKLNERSGACPRPQPKSSPQAQPATRPAVPPPAPIAHRESAPKETAPDYRDALSEAAEAAERAKREALKDEPAAEQPAPQVNPAINRRDERGRLKPSLSGSGVVIREPDWAK